MSFVHLMAFSDQSDEERHQTAPYTMDFVEVLYPNCEEQPVFTDLRPIRSTIKLNAPVTRGKLGWICCPGSSWLILPGLKTLKDRTTDKFTQNGVAWYPVTQNGIEPL